jgi:hypothetical protein
MICPARFDVEAAILLGLGELISSQLDKIAT